jgi:hypothetical protein
VGAGWELATGAAGAPLDTGANCPKNMTEMDEIDMANPLQLQNTVGGDHNPVVGAPCHKIQGLRATSGNCPWRN